MPVFGKPGRVWRERMRVRQEDVVGIFGVGDVAHAA